MAGGAQLLQLLLGIKAADFGREGDVDHPRLHHVLPHGIGLVAVTEFTDLVCGDFSIHAGNRQDLVTGCLDGTCLMAGNVTIVCCQHALIWAKNGSDCRQIGLGATHQKMNVCIRAAARLTDSLLRCHSSGRCCSRSAAPYWWKASSPKFSDVRLPGNHS